MSDLIRKDEIYKALALWDWQDLYLPVHFKKLVDECPAVGGGYTEQNVRDAYTDGYSDGIQKGYENALRNYYHLILRLWRPASEKPDKSGQYLCTLWDKNGVFLALMEWNETFGGRWQAVFEGEDSYSDIGNVLAWMPLPEPYTESKKMVKAIEFAKEIKRKKQAIKNTESPNLKKQYQKSIKRDIADLKYYCNQKNISYNEVWAKANCPIYASEQR